jgi:thiamine pyrophosphate-dependent acetolactate synthase large subunit-like protein
MLTTVEVLADAIKDAGTPSVREKLPIIVLSDEEIGLMRAKQKIKEISRYAIGIGGVDREKLGQGFGTGAIVVDSEVTLQSALKVGLASGRTTIIGAHIDPSGCVAPFNGLREL